MKWPKKWWNVGEWRWGFGKDVDADLIGGGASDIVQHLQLESADADRKRKGRVG